MHHQRSSLVPLMLVSYYGQHMSITLQHAQAITIPQQTTALGWDFSSLPHIIPSAPPPPVDLWHMTTLSS